jgi:hypothetical protein
MSREIITLPPQRFPVRKRGHAAMPGSGPQGETCGSCVHAVRTSHRPQKYTCGLRGSAAWMGANSEIERSDPACSKWASPKDLAL